MWVCKDYEMVNLENIDGIQLNICGDDDQFELDFLKDEDTMGFFFYENEEDLKRAYEMIINGLRNNIKVLNI